MTKITFTTANLCDNHAQLPHFQIADPMFKHFGNNSAFFGQISTLKVFEDHGLVAQTLAEKVNQRVLVIDGGASHRCALIDYELAKTACDNGWQGLLVYGCIRHSVAINQLPIGIYALHAHPLTSHTRGLGESDISLTFAGIHFKPDYFLYADSDGIIVSENSLI